MFLIFLFIFIVNGAPVKPSVVVRQNEIVAKEWDFVDLICPTTKKLYSCEFTSPLGEVYSMDVSHADNRIKDKKHNECAVTISPVRPEDKGIWYCSVPYIDKNGDIQVIHQMIQHQKIVILKK